MALAAEELKQQLFEKITDLPDSRLQEVLDFVECLSVRERQAEDSGDPLLRIAGSLLMAGSVLIDTWGWLALGHRRDARRQEVEAFYQTLSAAGDKLSTTDYILDEVITLLFRRERTEDLNVQKVP